MLESETFQDHAGRQSFGRKASLWVLIGMGILAFVGMLLLAFKVDGKGASEFAKFTLGLMSSGVTLVGLLYGAAQFSKASSHIGDALAGRASVATTTTTTTPPTPATIAAAASAPNSNAPPTAPTTPEPPKATA